MARIWVGLLGLLFSAVCYAQTVEVRNLRVWPAPDHTRLVLDVSGPVEHRIFTLAEPDRIVIDLINTRFMANTDLLSSEDGLVSRVRTGSRNATDQRVVLDVSQSARPKSFLLKPSGTYGHRLVVDLFPANPKPDVMNEQVGEPVASTELNLRDIVIAIDAGHGGEDPGASGPSGVREKTITLAVARKLSALIEREPGMRPVVVRSGDYYVGLRKRMAIARDARADLFISIHADAFRDPRVHGSAVYTLSHTGAGSEANRWLAARQNAADFSGGVSIDDKDDLLASVLLDLSQTATMNASSDVAKRVLTQLKTLGKTHKKSVQRAGFVVLKSPDIPSILVETAFISNPQEEKRLINTAHQLKLAESILKGIREYFERNAPPGTYMALRSHIIARGDTLSEIAERYRVSVTRLRAANELKDDQLKVGQVLKIPVGS